MAYLRFFIATLILCILTVSGFAISPAMAQTLRQVVDEDALARAGREELKLRLSSFPDLFSKPQGLSWGNDNAPLHIVGFIDYTNRLTKRMLSEMPEWIEDHPELHLELRELPGPNPHGRWLARFALATRIVHGDVGYKALHLRLLRMAEVPSRQDVGLIAQAGGFDLNSIEFIMDTPEIIQQLDDNFTSFRCWIFPCNLRS